MTMDTTSFKKPKYSQNLNSGLGSYLNGKHLSDCKCSDFQIPTGNQTQQSGYFLSLGLVFEQKLDNRTAPSGM